LVFKDLQNKTKEHTQQFLRHSFLIEQDKKMTETVWNFQRD